MHAFVFRAGLCASLLSSVAGCQSLGSTRSDQYLMMYQDFPPVQQRFQVCHDVGCENLTPVSLTAPQWRQLAAIFQSPAPNAEAERRQVGQAVALFERLVGPIANTLNDLPRNEMYGKPGAQLDCIAETVNTTTYLTLFKQQGWLRWHEVALPRHRGLFSLQAPHNTAVLVEKAGGREYVIDTWFHANGELPEIVPLESWLAGYDPDKQ